MAQIKETRTAPGELIPFETLFRESSELNVDFPDLEQPDRPMPEAFKQMIERYKEAHPASAWVPEKVGRIERFDYETAVYEDGKTHPKYANVYLPWCYDPEDAETKYDVIYFQHGNTGDPEFFKEPWTKILLDRLFLLEGIKPCIMVFTTYYFDVTKDVQTRRTTGSVPAGDGNYPGVKANFYREITEDLIPAVESKYHTHLAGTDPERVKKARDHRLFSGYSRGCVATWYMFHNALEYFRFFVPMSCLTTAGKSITEPPTEAEVIDYLSAPVQAHPELPFFIYACNGGPNDVQAMTEQMKYVPKAEVFSYGRDPKKNNLFFAVSDYFHGDFFAPQYFFNALPVLFGNGD